MKLFSILNKPANKASNKQAGIVFLEYVIMAFIVTVAVICALWWFYWHLQQMTWEIKSKLEVLKTLNCELQPPYGVAPGEQPTPGPGNGNGNGGEEIIAGPYSHSQGEQTTQAIPYGHFYVSIENLTGIGNGLYFHVESDDGTPSTSILDHTAPGTGIPPGIWTVGDITQLAGNPIKVLGTADGTAGFEDIQYKVYITPYSAGQPYPSPP